MGVATPQAMKLAIAASHSGNYGRRLVGQRWRVLGLLINLRKSSVNLYIRLFCTIATTAGKIVNQAVLDL